MQWSYSTAQSTTESYKDLKKTTKKLQSRTYLLRSLLEYTVLMNMGEVNTMNMTEWNTMNMSEVNTMNMTEVNTMNITV